MKSPFSAGPGKVPLVEIFHGRSVSLQPPEDCAGTESPESWGAGVGGGVAEE